MSAHLFAGVLQGGHQAIRHLARRRGSSTSIVCVIGLAIGINATVFSAVSTLLLRSPSYPDADRLVRLWFGDQEGQAGRAAVHDLVEWAQGSDTFEAIGGYRTSIRTLSVEGQNHGGVAVAEITASIFDVLRVYPNRGRTLLREDETRDTAPVVLVREGLLGDVPWPSGEQHIMLDGVRHRVVGTMAMPFEFPDRQTVAWIPLQFRGEPSPTSGQAIVSVHTVLALARLKDGVSVARARAEALGLFGGRDRRSPPQIASMSDIDVRSIRRALIIVQLAVMLVLLTACANAAHLLLARSIERLPELAVRTALGASRFRLVGELMIEGMLLAVAGGTLGLFVGAWGIEWLNSAAPPGLTRGESFRLDVRVLAFSIGISVIAAMLSVVAPCVQTLRLKPAAFNLYGRSAGSTTSTRASGRRVLIAAQFAIALALLVSTTVLIKSFLNLVAVDSGFDAKGVATARLRLPALQYSSADARTRVLADLLDVGRHSATLRSVALASYFPLDEQESIDFSVPGIGRQTGRRQAVSEDYFTTLGIPIVRGRGFRDTDTVGAPGVVIVSRAFATKYLATSDPLTSSIMRSGRTWQIVGIAEDVRGGGLTAPLWPVVYFTFRQLPYERLADLTALNRVVLFARAETESLKHLRDFGRTLQAAEASLTLDDLALLDERLRRPVAAPRFYASTMLIFSIIALLLAALGVSALVGYAVARHLPEIALRMALGATKRDVCFEIGRLVFVPMAVGIVLGIVVSRWMSSGFRELLFGVAPSDLESTVTGVVILVACGIVACVPSIHRAITIDPANVLRSH